MGGRRPPNGHEPEDFTLARRDGCDSGATHLLCCSRFEQHCISHLLSSLPVLTDSHSHVHLVDGLLDFGFPNVDPMSVSTSKKRCYMESYIEQIAQDVHNSRAGRIAFIQLDRI